MSDFPNNHWHMGAQVQKADLKDLNFNPHSPLFDAGFIGED